MRPKAANTRHAVQQLRNNAGNARAIPQHKETTRTSIHQALLSRRQGRPLSRPLKKRKIRGCLLAEPFAALENKWQVDANKACGGCNFNCKLAAQRHRLLYVYTAPCADPPTRPGPRRSLRPRYEATDPAPRTNCQGRCCRRRRPTNALRNIHRAAWQGAARN